MATPVGYPTAGAWFDFTHIDADGLPTVGEIRNMPVNGAVSLRGPHDTGTFFWGSGAADLTGIFGAVSSDFGSGITVTFAGKSDFFEPELVDGSPDSLKNVDNVALMLSLPNLQTGETLTFLMSLTANQYSTLQSFAESASQQVATGGNAIVGTAIVGTAVVGQGNAAQEFQIVRAFAQSLNGNVVQVGFQETSVYPWTVLGYLLRLSSQEATIP